MEHILRRIRRAVARRSNKSVTTSPDPDLSAGRKTQERISMATVVTLETIRMFLHSGERELRNSSICEGCMTPNNAISDRSKSNTTDEDEYMNMNFNGLQLKLCHGADIPKYCRSHQCSGILSPQGPLEFQAVSLFVTCIIVQIQSYWQNTP